MVVLEWPIELNRASILSFKREFLDLLLKYRIEVMFCVLVRLEYEAFRAAFYTDSHHSNIPFYYLL